MGRHTAGLQTVRVQGAGSRCGCDVGCGRPALACTSQAPNDWLSYQHPCRLFQLSPSNPPASTLLFQLPFSTLLLQLSFPNSPFQLPPCRSRRASLARSPSWAAPAAASTAATAAGCAGRRPSSWHRRNMPPCLPRSGQPRGRCSTRAARPPPPPRLPSPRARQRRRPARRRRQQRRRRRRQRRRPPQPRHPEAACRLPRERAQRAQRAQRAPRQPPPAATSCSWQ